MVDIQCVPWNLCCSSPSHVNWSFRRTFSCPGHCSVRPADWYTCGELYRIALPLMYASWRATVKGNGRLKSYSLAVSRAFASRKAYKKCLHALETWLHDVYRSWEQWWHAVVVTATRPTAKRVTWIERMNSHWILVHSVRCEFLGFLLTSKFFAVYQ
jgi:hypothetical protein